MYVLMLRDKYGKCSGMFIEMYRKYGEWYPSHQLELCPTIGKGTKIYTSYVRALQGANAAYHKNWSWVYQIVPIEQIELEKRKTLDLNELDEWHKIVMDYK